MKKLMYLLYCIEDRDFRCLSFDTYEEANDYGENLKARLQKCYLVVPVDAYLGRYLIKAICDYTWDQIEEDSKDE